MSAFIAKALPLTVRSDAVIQGTVISCGTLSWLALYASCQA